MRKLVTILLLTCLSITVATSVRSTVVLRMNIAQMVKLADFIFAGTVTSIESHWDKDSTTIFTFVTFSDIKVIKGNQNEAELTLRFKGGIVGNEMIIVDGMPEFVGGGREVVLAYEEKPGRYFSSAVVGLFQGRFTIKKDTLKGREIVVDSYGNPVVGSKGDELIFVVPTTDTTGGKLSTFTPLTRPVSLDSMGPISGQIETPQVREEPREPPKAFSYQPTRSKPYLREQKKRANDSTWVGIDYTWKPVGSPILLSPGEDPGTRFSEDQFLNLLKSFIK